MEVGQSVLRWLELAIPSFLEGKIGWGGRIRTFTVLINSEVSYQLDHAPTRCKIRQLAVFDERASDHFSLFFHCGLKCGVLRACLDSGPSASLQPRPQCQLCGSGRIRSAS